MINTPEFLRPGYENFPTDYKIYDSDKCFYNYYLKNNPVLNREYLPIFWSQIYFERNFGLDGIEDIQQYLNTLDPNKKYFTVIEIEDGILNDVSHLDIISFCSGGNGDYAIPFLRPPLEFQPAKKDMLCSFMGTIESRHPIREEMKNILQDQKGFHISEPITQAMYVNWVCRSWFSLCPRGRGKTSYRMFEVMELGSIPVYIYDEPWLPFEDDIDWTKIAILIHESEINKIPHILSTISEEKKIEYLKNIKEIFSQYFTGEKMCEKIIKKVNSLC